MRMTLTKNMPALREAAKQRIDAEAETSRLAYITPGAGQAMAYQEKYEEAVALILDPELGPLDVPHIFAEVGVTADTPAEVATVIVGMRTTWKSVSAEIEHKRLVTKAAIDAAGNPAELQSILSPTR